MRPIMVLVKFVVIVGGLGALAYFIMQQIPKTLESEADARKLTLDIAQIVGNTKTELSNIDLASVESKANSMMTIKLPIIERALVGLERTAPNCIAAEIVMLRLYDPRPNGYTSLVEGEPWAYTGESYQLGPFAIVRNVEPSEIKDMVAAFKGSSTVRG